MSFEELRQPKVSPFYADLKGLDLPSAIFTCGTEDCLVDDTVMMAVRWQMHGGKAVVRIFPGAPHGYTLADWEVCKEAKEGVEVACEFVREMVR